MNEDLELLVAVYENGMEADRIYQQVRSKHLKKEVHVIDAAVLVKDEDGNTSIQEEADLEGGEGSQFGAVVGGLMGLAFGPGGGILGAAAGAAFGVAAGAFTGNVLARNVDSGINNKHFKAILDTMEPTSSALVLVTERKWIRPLKAILKDALNARVKRYQLNVSIGESIEEETTDSQ